MVKPILSTQLEEILLDLIGKGIWATRERLGYKRAIHTLDGESKYLDQQPYRTNLDIKFDALAVHDSLIDRVVNYVNEEVLADRRDLKLIAPTAWQAKKYTLGVLNRLTDRLGLEIVERDQLRDHDRLLLLAGTHSQRMVKLWRKHDERIVAVVTLLGTRRWHIENDLELPAEKYHALASWDTLDQIALDRRRIMIPGVHEEEMDRDKAKAEAKESGQKHILEPHLSASTSQPVAGVRGELQNLKKWVKKITYPGEFLLSVNKFSDSWLYMVEFNDKEVRPLASQILQQVLSRYLSKHTEPHVLFCSEFGSLSEDEFATADVVNKAFRGLGHDSLSFERYWEPEIGVIGLDAEAFKGKRAIGFFVLSIHVDFLLDIIAKIREVGGEVTTLITIIERDDVGREMFAAQGVDLIPFILFNADKKELTTVLERSEATYTAYHFLFE